MRSLVLVFLFVCLSFNATSQNNLKQDNFSDVDSVASLYQGHSLLDLYNLTQLLTSPFKAEVEKFRAIYTWVCLNIANDYNLFLKNQKKREKLKDQPAALAEWNSGFSKKVFAKLLQEKKTVCTGYAYLVKEMAKYVGIECEIVDGYGRTTYANIRGEGRPNHSWNAVKLNGKWYLCDPTWSSGNIVVNGSEARFNKFYDPSYFLADPQLFVTNHYPLETKWLLLENPPSLKTFLNSPIIYRGAFQFQAIPISPNKLELNVHKGESIDFYFDLPSEKEVKEVLIRLNRGSTSSSVKIKKYRDTKNNLCLKYSFDRKGKYMVHILFDGVSIISYEVLVSN